jgi:hypothetical protein
MAPKPMLSWTWYRPMVWGICSVNSFVSMVPLLPRPPF